MAVSISLSLSRMLRYPGNRKSVLRAQAHLVGMRSTCQGGLRNMLSGGDRMRAKGQGSAVRGTAGWSGAPRNPVRWCMRSPESLQSGPGSLWMSTSTRCGGYAADRRSEGQDDRSAQPKALQERCCGRIIIHPEPLPAKPLSLPLRPSWEGAGGLLCQCPRQCGGTERPGARIGPTVPSPPLCRSAANGAPFSPSTTALPDVEDLQAIPSPARSPRNGSAMGDGPGCRPPIRPVELQSKGG